MKSVLASATLFAGAMAGVCHAPVPAYSAAPPAPPTPAPGPGYFGVISARSASPIHLQPLTARGGKFYLGGGPPSSYCPPDFASVCPPGDTTVFVGGNKTLSLGVVVPGGQEIYVAPGGALSYTQAHSVAVPTGSVRDAFSKEAPSNGNQFGYLKYGEGFVACPAGKDGYQVFGSTKGTTFASDCLGFNALTSDVKEAGAWQY